MNAQAVAYCSMLRKSFCDHNVPSKMGNVQPECANWQLVLQVGFRRNSALNVRNSMYVFGTISLFVECLQQQNTDYWCLKSPKITSILKPNISEQSVSPKQDLQKNLNLRLHCGHVVPDTMRLGRPSVLTTFGQGRGTSNTLSRLLNR